MPTFSVSLSMLFGESPFLERFSACKDAGFEYVEYMFPYPHLAETIRDLLRENKMTQVLFNLPAGDWEQGDRGIAGDSNRINEFREGVDLALEYAQVLGVELINCLVGKTIPGQSHHQQWQVLVENLGYATDRLAEENKTLLVEPVNTYDIPEFFLSTSMDGLRLLDAVAAPNLKLQYDVYHMSKMEGNLEETIERNLPKIGHIQIADNPGRHQPGTGEINYRFLLNQLDRMGYEGFVGLEYIPLAGTLSSFEWIEDLGFER